ncbi:hypothetical protein BGZ61DRAFT_191922 [Ilyonectria robusta]|uniref:uncharacterized protein n=1 Tax=Ilyonectria robusta TaxID=1079257 RepID=UPI001E8D3A02|nr:uncharacterized protein BGZ61DRAFT_191922 [Ilyonectria robusta]KAH8655953.1 hypothetical protein BGZ61DRAFT_191922 [Ilyonectria robusta]
MYPKSSQHKWQCSFSRKHPESPICSLPTSFGNSRTTHGTRSIHQTTRLVSNGQTVMTLSLPGQHGSRNTDIFRLRRPMGPTTKATFRIRMQTSTAPQSRSTGQRSSMDQPNQPSQELAMRSCGRYPQPNLKLKAAMTQASFNSYEYIPEASGRRRASALQMTSI